MSKYKLKPNIKWFERKRNALIKQLGKVSPFLNGSIVKKLMTCGNKEKCKCGSGEKHAGYYLMYSEENHPKTAYIPIDLHKDATLWCDEYKKVKNLIKLICDYQRAILKNYVKEKRLKRGRK